MFNETQSHIHHSDCQIPRQLTKSIHGVYSRGGTYYIQRERLRERKRATDRERQSERESNIVRERQSERERATERKIETESERETCLLPDIWQ